MSLKDIEDDGVDIVTPREAEERRKKIKKLKKIVNPSEALEKTAESLNQDTGAVDLASIPVDREIAQHVDELEVSNKREGWVYCWVYTGQNGIMVRRKQAEGWIVVQGEDKEAIEVKESATTVRRVGDTILMRLPEEKWIASQKRDEALTYARLHASTGTLQELAQKYRQSGVKIHTSEDATPSPVLSRAFAHAAARSVARGKVTDMIKAGTIPGMPVPGR